MNNVICFWWGNWPRGYEYVTKLRNMVAKNMTIPFKFVCFTDKGLCDHDEIEFRRIPQEVVDWERNLTKFWMYSPDSDLSGRVICMDLDTVIVSNIDDLLSYSGSWCGVYPIRYEKEGVQDPTHAGGLISFVYEEFTWVWDKMNSWDTKMRIEVAGKERFANQIIFNESGAKPDHWNYPKKHPQFWSYKAHIKRHLNGKLPRGAGFVTFHGNPRPHEVEEIPWVRKHWR